MKFPILIVATLAAAIFTAISISFVAIPVIKISRQTAMHVVPDECVRYFNPNDGIGFEGKWIPEQLSGLAGWLENSGHEMRCTALGISGVAFLAGILIIAVNPIFGLLNELWLYSKSTSQESAL